MNFGLRRKKKAEGSWKKKKCANDVAENLHSSSLIYPCYSQLPSNVNRRTVTEGEVQKRWAATLAGLFTHEEVRLRFASTG
mmetsp:Transcript_28173/g.45356  ORF Transcript_28173/g.45356 Transcript_28173/m.45356 type:complete len:81 (-) Transcript_28173:49-291(-)